MYLKKKKLKCQFFTGLLHFNGLLLEFPNKRITLRNIARPVANGQWFASPGNALCSLAKFQNSNFFQNFTKKLKKTRPFSDKAI